jgi:hypothetical protein
MYVLVLANMLFNYVVLYQSANPSTHCQHYCVFHSFQHSLSIDIRRSQLRLVHADND